MTADYDDMVQMPELSAEAILGNLEVRFARDAIFTNIASMVVKLNPYKPLASEQGRPRQQVEQNLFELYRPDGWDAISSRPHIFSVARATLAVVLAGRDTAGAAQTSNAPCKDQAILISGESGAGKTEATNMLLRYFAHASGQLRAGASAGTGQACISQHRASVSASAGGVGGVEAALVCASPILESFGNACTLQNNNSSRFGKWISISFARRTGHIQGASIVKYLLEESRVTSQARGERNYNIFYQLLQGLQHQVWSLPQMALPTEQGSVLGRQPWDFYLLNGRLYTGQQAPDVCFTIPGVDDLARAREVLDAMQQLHFTQQEVTAVLSVVFGVLHLGNVSFTQQAGEGEGKSKLKDGMARAALEAASLLLCVSAAVLEQCLLVKVITSGHGTVISIPRTLEQCADVRDTVCRSVFGGLFTWLVHRINTAIRHSITNEQLLRRAEPQENSTVSIGVLDIFGFEVFERNSLDQLCINYANEKLQEHFLKDVFELEQMLYQEEGVDVGVLEYTDNRACVALIEQRPTGILALLADELSLPKGSDRGLLSKLNARYAEGKNSFFFSEKLTEHKAFGVKHYAQPVTYEVEGFLDKARMQVLSEDVTQLFLDSKEELVKSIFAQMSLVGSMPQAADEKKARSSVPNKGDRGDRLSVKAAAGRSSLSANSVSGPAAGSRRRSSSSSAAKSLASSFQTSLALLMHALGRADSHYIRCLKPNSNKRPDEFDRSLVLRQLRTSGLLDAVTVRKMGYGYRMKQADFCLRFGALVQNGPDQKTGSDQGDANEAAICLQVLEQASKGLAGADRKWALGKTRIFWSKDMEQALQSSLAELVKRRHEAATRIQCAVRTHWAQRTLQQLQVEKAERRRKEEEERKRKEEEERKRKEEEARKRKEEQERKRKEEEERKRKEEEERKRKEEEERKRKEEEKRKRQKEEQGRKEEEQKRKEEEQKSAEESQQRQQREEERRRQDAAERLRQDMERKQSEETERKQKAETERRKKEKEREDEQKRAQHQSEQDGKLVELEERDKAEQVNLHTEPAHAACTEQTEGGRLISRQAGQANAVLGGGAEPAASGGKQDSKAQALAHLQSLAAGYKTGVGVHAAAEDEALQRALIDALMAGATEKEVDFAKSLILHAVKAQRARQEHRKRKESAGDDQAKQPARGSSASSSSRLSQKGGEPLGSHQRSQSQKEPLGSHQRRSRVQPLSKQERARKKLQMETKQGTLVKVRLREQEDAGFGDDLEHRTKSATLGHNIVIPAIVVALSDETSPGQDGWKDEDLDHVKVISHQEAEHETLQTEHFATMTLKRGMVQAVPSFENADLFQEENGKLEVTSVSSPASLAAKVGQPSHDHAQGKEPEIEPNEVDLADDQGSCCTIQ